jgi:hypothetical protein
MDAFVAGNEIAIAIVESWKFSAPIRVVDVPAPSAIFRTLFPTAFIR